MSAPSRTLRPRFLAVGLLFAALATAGCPRPGDSDRYYENSAAASVAGGSAGAAVDAAALRSGSTTSPWETDFAADQPVPYGGAVASGSASSGQPIPVRESPRSKRVWYAPWRKVPAEGDADRTPYVASNTPSANTPGYPPYGGGSGQPAPVDPPYNTPSPYGGAPTPVTTTSYGGDYPTVTAPPRTGSFDPSTLGVRGTGSGTVHNTSVPSGGGYTTVAPAPVYGGANTPGPVITQGAPLPAPSLPTNLDAPRPAPRPANPALDQAKQLIQARRYNDALPVLERETQRDAANPEVWLWYGDSLYNTLQFERAVQAYDQCLRYDPTNYLAMRGQGFSHLHHGHEFWSRHEAAYRRGDTAASNAALDNAHKQYQQAINNLNRCVQVNKNDDEAMYGRGMAVEGFSRRLYSLARGWINESRKAANTANEDLYRSYAQQYAAQCAEVIRMGLESAQRRIEAQPKASDPRTLAGALHVRLAMLNHYMGKEELARGNLQDAIRINRSILEEINPDHATARAAIAECERYLNGQWPAAPLA